MSKTRTYQLSLPEIIRIKAVDYCQLAKIRLTTIVVFSAVIGYVFAGFGTLSWTSLGLLTIGGFLITAASNAFNQVLEKDLDRLMKRTQNRPLATNRMHVTEAILAAGIMGVVGILILAFYFNNLAALIGALSLLMYSFIYTPVKRLSNVAVFIGAIPGALPPVIGWVCFTGSIDFGALLLFSIQFLWQFPHFWAIAWVADSDYRAAGFKLLPSKEGKGKATAIQNIIYILFLIPVSLVPFFLGITGWVSAIVIFVCGLVFLWQAFLLYLKCDDKRAADLMFGSFIYLPVVLLALIFDKI